MKTISPSTPEERSPIYEDLLEILTVGFLAYPVKLGDVTISMRSLNHADFYLARQRTGPGTDTVTWNNWLLASSIWMLDGQILLEDPSAQYEVYSLCKGMPQRVKLDLLYILKQLLLKLNAATMLVEAFCYEKDSRFLWQAYGVHLLDHSGIPGASRMGLSTPHRVWISFNRIEDDREQWLADWTRTKMLASTTAPKGIKKLNAADETAFTQEERRRQAVLDKHYYRVVHGIDLDIQGGGDGRYQDIRMAITAEELEEEMRRVRAGEKDEHDRIVDFYKRQVRERIEKERVEAEERAERISRQLAEAGVNEPPLRPVMVSGKFMQPKTTARLYDNKGHYLYDRYLKGDQTPGQLQMSPQGPVVTPEGPSLNEKIAQRRITLNEG